MTHELWIDGKKVLETSDKEEARVTFKTYKRANEKSIKSYFKH